MLTVSNEWWPAAQTVSTDAPCISCSTNKDFMRVTGLKPFPGFSAFLIDVGHFCPWSCRIWCLQPLPAVPQLCLRGCIHSVGRSKLTAWSSRARKAPLKGIWSWDDVPSRASLSSWTGGVHTTKLQMYTLELEPNTSWGDCLSLSYYRLLYLGFDLILTWYLTGVSVTSSNWAILHLSNFRKQCIFI